MVSVSQAFRMLYHRMKTRDRTKVIIKKSLRVRYYRAFMLLIVVPMVAVWVLALLVMRGLYTITAGEKIIQAQTQAASVLTEELSDTAMMLAHTAYVNQQQSLALATHMNRERSVDAKNELAMQLNKVLDSTVVPSSDIYDLHYYFRDGAEFRYKDNLHNMQPLLKQYEAYDEALTTLGRTVVGPVLSESRYTVGRHFLLSILFVPDRSDAYNDVTMIGCYFLSRLPELLRSFSRDPQLGQMLVVDEHGRVLISQGQPPFGSSIANDPVLARFNLETASPAVYRVDGRKYSVVQSPVAYTSWRVISVVDRSVSLQAFNRIALLSSMIIVLLFCLYMIYSAWFLRDIIRPVHLLSCAMSKMQPVNASANSTEFSVLEYSELAHNFNDMLSQIDQLLLQVQQREQAKMKAELDALQSQINPHFLANTLNSIRFTAMIAKFESVQRMAEALISILTASFNRGGKDSTLGQELEVLNSYVYLMKIRYDNRFEIVDHIPPALQSCLVLKLTLQPLVENAIIHGFEEKETMGKIILRAREENGNLLLEVWDDGIGMSNEQIEQVMTQESERGSIGIRNVDSRIKLHYGEAFGISIRSQLGEYTNVKILLPKQIQGGSELV